MSTNKLDAIKNKVRQTGGSSVHAQLIDTNIIEEDRKAMSAPEQQKVDDYVHVDVNVNENKKGRKRQRAAKFEDRHDRHTVWIEKEIGLLIEEETGGERGEKTRIFNEALKEYFSKRKR